MKRVPLMIYLPTEVKEALKRETEKQKVKMSRFMLELICRELGMEKTPEQYVKKNGEVE